MTALENSGLGLRYLRVANSLRQQVIDGVFQPGERLPRQHDLAHQFQVAFTTLKRALDLLEQEGYIVRKVGQGTYASIPDTHEPTALVVDDDAGVRRLLKRGLANNGWICVAVESGMKALEELKSQRIDVVLLDLVMPEMNGAETFRAIREFDEDVPVILITAYADSALMDAALEVGPFAVMRKPFTLDQLRMVLANIVTDRRSGRQSP